MKFKFIIYLTFIIVLILAAYNKENYLSNIYSRIELDEYTIKLNGTITSVDPLLVDVSGTTLDTLHFNEELTYSLNDSVDIYIYSNMIFVGEEYLKSYILSNFEQPYVCFTVVFAIVIIFITIISLLKFLVLGRYVNNE